MTTNGRRDRVHLVIGRASFNLSPRQAARLVRDYDQYASTHSDCPELWVEPEVPQNGQPPLEAEPAA
jgi:hypothetical protein